MELYYENSRKERVDLTKEPYLVKDMAELLDYTWKYDTEDEMITGFSRGICTIPFGQYLCGYRGRIPATV